MIQKKKNERFVVAREKKRESERIIKRDKL